MSFAFLAVTMKLISGLKQSAPAATSFAQHFVTCRIWWLGGNAMIRDMDLQSGPVTPSQLLFPCPRDDLAYRKILAIWIFQVEQGSSQPDFIGNFNHICMLKTYITAVNGENKQQMRIKAGLTPPF
jgi:hypothetical protein